MKKRILLMSQSEELITNFIDNNLKKETVPKNLTFFQMMLKSENPEEFKIKNIHNILLSLDDLNSYSGLIILYTIPYGQPYNEDLTILNERLKNAGIRFVASIMVLHP
ncbi:MAG: hypothetical protein NTW54_05170, partial [Bacteroidetes bacterium]|nr:hypothetical protein [Bacteroidota bacterium]